jgi:hypothetical protein
MAVFAAFVNATKRIFTHDSEAIEQLWLDNKFDNSFNNVRLDGALTAVSSRCFFQVFCIVRMRLILPVATINLGKEAAAKHDNERVTWKILNHEAQVFHPTCISCDPP